MSLKENLKSITEDYIIDKLCDKFRHSDVDRFLKDLDEEILTGELMDYIGDIISASMDRVDEFADVLGNTKDEDEDDY